MFNNYNKLSEENKDLKKEVSELKEQQRGLMLHVARLMNEKAELQGKIKDYEDRLEISYVWRKSPEGALIKSYLSEEEKRTMVDGIDARESTIRMMQNTIEELNAQLNLATY